jgi:polyisoprenoid-binding protein YceI
MEMNNLARVLLLIAVASPAAQAADWSMDAANSKLEFIATFEKTDAPGIFKVFDTRMRFDPDRPEGGRLDVSIQVTSADMDSADINNAIRGHEWFDFAAHPHAEFHSTEIRRTQAGRYVAHGQLNVKGIQQTIDVPFAWRAAADTATMQGEFTLKRGAFGIGTGEWTATDVIGAEVKIKFKVQLHRAG